MKEKEGITKGIGHKLVVSLLSAAIIGIAGTLMPGGWSAVFGFTTKAFTAAISWLGSSIPTPAWLLTILGLIAVGALITVTFVIYSATRKVEPILPTEGNYFGVKWRWRLGSHGVEDPMSFCPHCDMQLYPQNKSGYRAVDLIGFKCDACNWESQDFEFPKEVLYDKVVRLIQKEYRATLSDKTND